MDDDNAPWHAHIYYTPAERSRAEALRECLLKMKASGESPQLRFIGALRDYKVGPHPQPQFEIHFIAGLLPMMEHMLSDCGLTTLVHPLTLDDLADHTRLAHWMGTPIDLDLSVLDPPGVNQGFARFGKSDV